MAGAVAFACFLVIFAHSAQVGVFDTMIDLTARLFPGHAQIQHPDYRDNPRVRYTVENAAATLAEIERHPLVQQAAPRVLGHGLVSVDEKSFGAMLIGLDPQREFLSIRENIVTGRYIEGAGETVMGTILARNLGAEVGDELIVLGTGKEGSVAPLVATVVGIFESGMADIDRGQVHVHIADLAEAMGLDDEVHAIALMMDSYVDSETMAAENGGMFAGHRFLHWSDLSPEVREMMDMKFASSQMLYVFLVVLVTFGVVNSCIMTVFERTKEFGMLIALGMRPGAIMRMLQVETIWMTVLGLVLGIGLSGAIVGALAVYGIDLGEAYADMTQGFTLPDRLRPAFSVPAAMAMSAVMIAATQIACVAPSLRLFRLKVVDALATEE